MAGNFSDLGNNYIEKKITRYSEIMPITVRISFNRSRYKRKYVNK